MPLSVLQKSQDNNCDTMVVAVMVGRVYVDVVRWLRDTKQNCVLVCVTEVCPWTITAT